MLLNGAVNILLMVMLYQFYLIVKKIKIIIIINIKKQHKVTGCNESRDKTTAVFMRIHMEFSLKQSTRIIKFSSSFYNRNSVTIIIVLKSIRSHFFLCGFQIYS